MKNFDYINYDLSEDSLSKLLDNKLGVIVVRNAVEDGVLSKLIEYFKFKNLITSYDYSFNSNTVPEALHFMTTHYLYEEHRDQIEYLDAAKQSIDQLKQLEEFVNFNFGDFLYQCFQECSYKLERAKENDREYSQMMVRSLKDGALLHADYAPHLKEDWAIKKIRSELAWNIFIETPEAGGHTIIYDKQWVKSDDSHIIQDSYGYKEDLVDGCHSISYKPTRGDFVLFNSRNFHKVEPSFGKKDRITIGGHFGLKKGEDKTLIGWV